MDQNKTKIITILKQIFQKVYDKIPLKQKMLVRICINLDSKIDS